MQNKLISMGDYSFALGLVLKLKEKGTWKWPITVTFTLAYYCLRLAK